MELGVLAEAAQTRPRGRGRLRARSTRRCPPRGPAPRADSSRSRAGRRARGSARRTATQAATASGRWVASTRASPPPMQNPTTPTLSPDDRRGTSSTAPDMSLAARSSAAPSSPCRPRRARTAASALVQVGGQRHEAGRAKRSADVLDVRHEAPPLLDHDHARARARCAARPDTRPSEPLLGKLIISPMAATLSMTEVRHDPPATNAPGAPRAREVGAGEGDGHGLHPVGPATRSIPSRSTTCPDRGWCAASRRRTIASHSRGGNTRPTPASTHTGHLEGAGRLDQADVIGVEDHAARADGVDLHHHDIGAGDVAHAAVANGPTRAGEVLAQQIGRSGRTRGRRRSAPPPRARPRR